MAGSFRDLKWNYGLHFRQQLRSGRLANINQFVEFFDCVSYYRSARYIVVKLKRRPKPFNICFSEVKEAELI
jgi:hypothetical protein